MTRPPGGDDPDGSDGDGRDSADEPRGLLRSILALLEEMDAAGERRGSGHARPGKHTSVDFSVSVGGLSDGDEGPHGAGEGPLGGGSRSSEPDPGAHVTTRETPEGMVVVADLPGVTEDDVDTTLDPEAGELVIGVRGDVAARLPLESDGWTVVDSRFANGVLEVEIRRD